MSNQHVKHHCSAIVPLLLAIVVLVTRRSVIDRLRQQMRDSSPAEQRDPIGAAPLAAPHDEPVGAARRSDPAAYVLCAARAGGARFVWAGLIRGCVCNVDVCRAPAPTRPEYTFPRLIPIQYKDLSSASH